MKVHQRLGELQASGIDVVAVGFSDAGRLEFVRREFAPRITMISDPDLRWYRALSIGRGSWTTVFSPRILWSYARLVAHGYRLRRPTEDLRQLGGDVLIREATVVGRWIGTESERRPSVDAVIAAANADK